VSRRCRLSRPEYRFERAITFDPNVGSPSNFYRSFRKLFFLEYVWNRYSVRRRSRRSRPEYQFERAITFDPPVWIALKFLQEFPEAVFLGVHVELLLGESEVSSLETRVPVRKGHNF